MLTATFLALTILLDAAPPSARPPPQQLSLTISGGASMGAYEAGLAWALVRYARANVRNVNLAGVSGASAGGINSLLAAALWCEATDEGRDDTIEDNLFSRTWLPVGMDGFLPESDEAYARDDGIFRSAPLEEIYGNVERLLFNGGRRFRPGCMVPLGVSVTRTRPDAVEASGLVASPQRFVVAWRFAVDDSGHPRLVAQPLGGDHDSARSMLQLGLADDATNTRQLGNALMASGAVPFIFRPRTLCDCALQCAPEDRAEPNQCPGPAPGERLSQLTCAAVPPLGRRTLCRHAYVDGGIFDNVPLSLTIELVESHAERLALFPTIYFVVDPDMRRFPLPPSRGNGTGEAIEPFQLVKNLVATARSASLAQAATLARWQLDTRILLDRTSVLFGDFASLQDEALRIVGNEGTGTPTGLRKDAFYGKARGRLARFLFSCARDPALTHACAEQLRGSAPLSPQEDAPVPSPAEILAFAHQMEDALEATDATVTRASKERLEERLARLPNLVDAVFVYAADLRFLQGELERLRVQLDAPRLEVLRDELLEVIGRSRLMAQTQRILLSSVAAAIVREEPVPGSEEQALVEQLVSRLDTPLDATLAQAGAEGSRLAALRALSRRLDDMADRAEELSSAAAQLHSGLTGERRLVVTSRFLPLSASSLLGFGGFLDPTLREVDFNVGVYEMATQLAEFRCSIRDPYDASGKAAALRTDAPWELDFRGPASAECMGEELEHVARALNLSQSAHALAFFSMAAKSHLAALMGSRTAAEAVLRKPAWAWLEKAAAAHPRDDVEIALGVLTSRPAPCHAGDPDALCFEDPGYSALMAGLRQARFHAVAPEMESAMSDPDGWLAHLERRLADRVHAGARNGTLKIPPSVDPVIQTGELVLRRDDALGGGPRILLDSSSAPSLWGHLVPYRVRFEVTNGGLAFSWFEPSLRLSSTFAVESLFDAVDLYEWQPSTSVGLLPTMTLGGVAFSGGPRWSMPWRGSPALPGVEARLGLFQQRLAVAVGLRSLQEGHRNWTVGLSVADLNGLAYWLLFSP